MATTPTKRATIADAAALTAADPEVMGRAKKLMMRLFDEADFIIETGSSAEIAKMTATVIPAILRETTRAEQSEADRKMAEQYAQMRGEIAASLERKHDV